MRKSKDFPHARLRQSVNPGFKLMPVNEVKKHFIRIDKKSLVDLGISKIYSIDIDKEISNTIYEDDFEQKNYIKTLVNENNGMFKKLNKCDLYANSANFSYKSHTRNARSW